MPAQQRAQRPASNQPPLYAVQPGDTLTGIAASQLGDGRQWRDIWDMNASIVADPGRIRVGQLLAIPALDDPDDFDWETAPAEEDPEEEERKSFRQDIFRSIARLEGADPALVHFDSARVNVGKCSWTGTHIPELMVLYMEVARENALLGTLFAFFGGEWAYREILDRFERHGVHTNISPEEANAFRATGRHAVLREAQNRKGAADVAQYLGQIAAFEEAYPYLDADGAISEMAAAVLCHSAHQSGNAAAAYRAVLGSRSGGGIRRSMAEPEFLKRIEQTIIGWVDRKYQTGVRNRYDAIRATFAYSRRYVL